MFETGQRPEIIAEESNLIQVSDVDSVSSAVEQALTANPGSVGDYMEGKDKAMGFLVGQVMKISKGKANPQLASKLVKEKLDHMKQAVPH